MKVMVKKISKRLLEIVDALPLRDGLRILEIGCGPGVTAREIAKRFGNIFVLGVDRSNKAIDQATQSCATEIKKGKLKFVNAAIEDLELSDEKPFDFAFAVRVGALDGRHPEIEAAAISRIAIVLKPKGKLFIDGGDPIKEVDLRKDTH
jgi:ubiquinone/menaquinone biosynthesis C-methylase UbiE